MKVKVIGLSRKEIKKINNILDDGIRITNKGKVKYHDGQVFGYLEWNLDRNQLQLFLMCMSIALNARLIHNDFEVTISKKGKLLRNLLIDEFQSFVWDALAIYNEEGHQL